VRVPQRIEALVGMRIVSIACGLHHSLALTADGHLYSWGSSEYGQQGGAVGLAHDWASGERGQQHSTLPRRFNVFPTDKTLSAVACGHLFNIALTTDGELYALCDVCVLAVAVRLWWFSYPIFALFHHTASAGAGLLTAV
jgi:alpha-tubulin suppressor-like RCC1 family protein